MNIPAKASIAIGTIGALAWVGLFALFYRSSNDHGKYSEMNFGQVRGESVERFQLPKDSILLSSKRGQNEYKDDASWQISHEAIYQYIYHPSNKEKKLWE